MEIIAQINTGGFHNTTTTSEEIIKSLKDLNVSKIIIGWSLDRKLYEEVIAYCVSRDIETYLWLPIFSEIGSVKKGYAIKGQSGKDCESYKLSDDEDFTFFCVNQQINTDNVFTFFEEHFSGLKFAGIFLDKIRYPSFANGLDSVISCFCPECKSKFPLEKSYDTSTLLSSIVSYENNEYKINDEKWNSFFRFKANSVYKSLVHITEYFRMKGFKIGLDVYAPFLSFFVGQDIPLLSLLADFVKPMMYSDTFAPAGIPFELDCMLKELNDDGVKFKETIGYENEEFLTNEIANLVKKSDCDIYAGIEVNRTNPIALIHPEHIEKNIQRYKGTNMKGFVLSWNVLNAPKENLNVINFLK